MIILRSFNLINMRSVYELGFFYIANTAYFLFNFKILFTFCQSNKRTCGIKELNRKRIVILPNQTRCKVSRTWDVRPQAAEIDVIICNLQHTGQLGDVIQFSSTTPQQFLFQSNNGHQMNKYSALKSVFISITRFPHKLKKQPFNWTQA